MSDFEDESEYDGTPDVVILNKAFDFASTSQPSQAFEWAEAMLNFLNANGWYLTEGNRPVPGCDSDVGGGFHVASENLCVFCGEYF